MTNGVEVERRPESCKSTRAAIRYRNGQLIMQDVLRREAVELRRAGFRAFPIQLTRDDGLVLEADLWSQESPTLAAYLNAAYLLFDDAPGSLSWMG